MLALARALAWCGAGGMLLLIVWTIVLIPFTPAISDLRKAKADAPAIVLSADGRELAVLRRMNREWVELDRISPHVIDALIATEDHRFYQHFGVDLRRTAAGILRTLQGDPEGGSTLTQQLARNLYPEEIGRQRTINRKLKELITALKIEMAYSKQEILLTYLNTMPFLYNAFGIEMAARTYFDKPAARLNVLESATLVGMLKGTSYYNPVLNPERALARRNVVLAQMVKRGKLGQNQFAALKSRPLHLDFERQPEPLGEMPHFTNHLRKWLVDWADRNDYNLYADGLVIHTTIDSRLQAMAQQAATRRLAMLQAVADVEWGMAGERLLSTSVHGYAGMRRQVQPFGHLWRSRPELVDAFVRESGAYRAAIADGAAPDAALAALKADAAFMSRLRADKTRLETGMVALDPLSGAVRAWVGSRDFDVDNFDHVARARRQPGSTFKPFVYGAALEQGMDPQRRFTDREVEIPMGNGSVWRPTDAAAPSGREMSLRDALAYSKNTITAQVMQEAGPHAVAAFARKLGVRDSVLDPVPALALGTSPVSLLEMASAYGTIASGGVYRAPLLVTHITGSDGQELARFASEGERVVSAEVAHELTEMLRAVVERGTGRAVRSQFGVRGEVAGKTGTTQNNTDGWFMLMHPRLVAGAWVGFNDARIAMRSSHWGQGAQTALPVVGEFARRAQQAGLMDSRAHFPQPPASWWDRTMQQVAAWFGWEDEADKPQPDKPRARTRPAAPAPAPAPAPVPAPDDLPPQMDELERIRRQAWEDEAAAAAAPDAASIPAEQTGSVEKLPEAVR
ncbi:penicillin-binding protein 1A [Noviherbaspirillum aridicola]|uniref:penicillin-binding protein 1A n=1 Tax=Noviherbaspirillum aridicola TaxID=2849687 RepID=UPI001EE58667|nr:transglycosylase domain-containing protein [Noviherbaspirillum aridicola]